MNKKYKIIVMFIISTVLVTNIIRQNAEIIHNTEIPKSVIIKPNETYNLSNISFIPETNNLPKVTETYLGSFLATSYCIENYYHICNDGTPHVTATGGEPIPLQTIAVDPNVIPLGSKLRVKNENIDIIVTANDKGGSIKGNKIDIANTTHQLALEWGKQNVDVWILN